MNKNAPRNVLSSALRDLVIESLNNNNIEHTKLPSTGGAFRLCIDTKPTRCIIKIRNSIILEVAIGNTIKEVHDIDYADPESINTKMINIINKYSVMNTLKNRVAPTINKHGGYIILSVGRDVVGFVTYNDNELSVISTGPEVKSYHLK